MYEIKKKSTTTNIIISTATIINTTTNNIITTTTIINTYTNTIITKKKSLKKIAVYVALVDT